MNDHNCVPQRPHDGEFSSFEEWVNHATSWLGNSGAVCFDAKDRPCQIGKHFMIARDENTFPVRFWFPEYK